VRPGPNYCVIDRSAASGVLPVLPVVCARLLRNALKRFMHRSRKAYIMSWTAADIPGFLETSRITNMRKYHAELRAELEMYKPERCATKPGQ
jgi:hypothetical protein